MQIYYRSRANDPTEGDVKVLNSGETFIRWQQRHNGCYVVSRGKPVFDWIPIEDAKEKDSKYLTIGIKSALKMLEKSGFSEFKLSRPQPKGRTIRLNMKTEHGRSEFTRLTGIPSGGGHISSCTLTMR